MIPLGILSAAQAKVQPPSIFDSFDRPNGELGSTETGQAWAVTSVGSGTMLVSVNRIAKGGQINVHTLASVDLEVVNMRASILSGSNTLGPGVRVSSPVDGYFFWRNGLTGYLTRRLSSDQSILKQEPLEMFGVYALEAKEETGGTNLTVTVDGEFFMSYLDDTQGRPMTTRAGVIGYANSAHGDDFLVEPL